MALRDKMRESAAQYLRPNESIEQVIAAQTASQYLAALTGIFIFLGLNKYRVIAVTNERILVLDTGSVNRWKARGVVTELPRSTRLGPTTGMWHVIPAGAEKLRVPRIFFKDVEAADADLGQTAA
jgi:hypothetical protein